MSKWNIHNKKKVYVTPHRVVEEWDVENPEGHVDNYSIHICPEVVIVFGLSKDGKVLLLDQFFIAQQLRLHTLVAGAVDRGRDRLEVAKEELREEAGCEAEEMIELGYSYLGKWTTGKRYFYLAKGVEKKHEQELEDAEDIEVSFVSIDDFKKKLRNSEIHDQNSVACSYRALDYLGEI